MRIFIGQQADPAERTQLEVSEADYAKLGSRGYAATFFVTDLLTGRSRKLRTAACALPGCYCALVFADEPAPAPPSETEPLVDTVDRIMADHGYPAETARK